ncbi:MAG TPA: methyltransferase domain-containing protein, partial [Dehalococcoidia bacterium]
LPFADHTADVTVAFEIIEHFEPWEAKQIVDELDRVTKPGGALILSTPNRFSLESAKGIARFLWDGTVWNARDETHQHIFNRRELLALLKPRFKVEECYGYYPIPEVRRRGLPGTYAITTNPLLVNVCFLLLVVAAPLTQSPP